MVKFVTKSALFCVLATMILKNTLADSVAQMTSENAELDVFDVNSNGTEVYLAQCDRPTYSTCSYYPLKENYDSRDVITLDLYCLLRYHYVQNWRCINGTWERVQAISTNYGCRKPILPSYLHIFYGHQSQNQMQLLSLVNIGTNVHYKCMTGTRLMGVPTNHCGTDGRWVYRHPRCVIAAVLQQPAAIQLKPLRNRNSRFNGQEKSKVGRNKNINIMQDDERVAIMINE